MYEFDSLSVSTYEASSLAAKLTEKSSDGWDVVAIVPTGSDVTAFLKRAGSSTNSTDSAVVADAGPSEATGAPTSSWDTGAATPESAPAAPSEPSGWGSAPESSPSSWGTGSGDNSGSSWGSTSGGTDTGSSWGSQSSAPASAPSAPAAAATPSVPPGWYADPAGRYELRYWDGSAWTEHVSRAGQQYTDPPVA